MEDISWVHEELRFIARSMHALILMYLNDYFVNISTKHMIFAWR
jgi:hypothetical protein